MYVCVGTTPRTQDDKQKSHHIDIRGKQRILIHVLKVPLFKEGNLILPHIATYRLITLHHISRIPEGEEGGPPPHTTFSAFPAENALTAFS